MPTLEEAIVTTINADSAVQTNVPGLFAFGLGEADLSKAFGVVVPASSDSEMTTGPRHGLDNDYLFSVHSNSFDTSNTGIESLIDLLDRRADSITFDNGNFEGWVKLGDKILVQDQDNPDRWSGNVTYRAMVDRLSPE